MPYACPQCDQLWSEYARATIDHVKLEGDLEIASIQQRHEQVEELQTRVEAAGGRRTALRQAIADHEKFVHPEVAQSATSDIGLRQ